MGLKNLPSLTSTDITFVLLRAQMKNKLDTCQVIFFGIIIAFMFKTNKMKEPYRTNIGLSFDVIIPSIPGYAFSDIPAEPGMNPKKIANLFANLMTEELGYEKFVAHGGDWGTSITEQMALYHADSLLGIHLTDVPFSHL